DMTSFKRFLTYLAHYKKQNWTAVILGVLCGSTTVYMTYLIGRGIDQLVGKDQVDFSALFKVVGLFTAIVVITTLSQWVIQRLGNFVSYQSVADLRKDTFNHLNQLPLRYYDQNSHGDITSRFTNDMDNISIAVAQIFNQLFSGMSVVIIARVVMLKMSGV